MIGRESVGTLMKFQRSLVSLLSLLFIATCLAVPTLAFSKEKTLGEFIIKFDMPKKNPYKEIARIIKKSGHFQEIVKGINDNVGLRTSVQVHFTQDDSIYYDPNTQRINVSYDHIHKLLVYYSDEYPKATGEQLIRFMLRATTFILYHEMAHAFIDVNELPIVSNEETAADNLAVIFALELTEDGYNIVMDMADLYDIIDFANKQHGEEDLWDEHALSSQRFYNVVCLAYGKYPKQVTAEINEIGSKIMKKFLKERGGYCQEEYYRQYKGWTQLLKRFIKK